MRSTKTPNSDPPVTFHSGLKTTLTTGAKTLLMMEPKITLLNGITIIVGSIIGSGIFITPTTVLKYAGSINMSLIIWIITGIVNMIGAYCYTELGCMITKTGADYAYVLETFGSMMGFVRLWMECMIIRPCTIAIILLTFVLYLLKPIFGDCEAPQDAVNLLSACVLSKYLVLVCGLTLKSAVFVVILTSINCWDTRWAAKFQDYMTFFKLIVISTIIVSGMWQLIVKGRVEHFTFRYTNSNLGMIASAHYSAMFAYNGWYYLNYIVEQLENPVRNLPLAVGVSITMVIIINVLMNVSFFTVLSPNDVLSTNAVAVLYGHHAIGNVAFWVIPLIVAFSALGAANGCILSSSRLFYAGAKNKHMPQFLIMIQIHQYTPVPSIVCISLLSLIYLCIGGVQELLQYLGFAIWVSLGIGVLCVPVLRITKPELPRPIRVNLILPIFYVLFTLALIIFPIIHDFRRTVYGIILILTSVPAYLILVKWENKPGILNNAIEWLTCFIQKLLLVLPESARF